MAERATPPVQFTRTSDGVSIAYMIWPGQGIPFLRVRTLGAMPMALSATMEEPRRFAGDRPMVWFDWRATGQSARQVPAAISDLFLDIDAVMSVIDSNAVDVLAPGMACFPACTYGVSRRGRWRSLVLTDPAPRIEGSPFGLRTRPGYEADFEGFLAAATRHFLPPMSNEEAERVARSWADTVPLETDVAFRSIERNIDLTETLPTLDLPVLILKVEPRSRADSVAALIPNSILLAPRTVSYTRGLRQKWDEYIGSKFAEPPQAVTADPSLTRRESEILAHLASGRSNAEIAAELCLSVRTIERHVQNIYTKLNVHNRVEAANRARKLGLG